MGLKRLANSKEQKKTKKQWQHTEECTCTPVKGRCPFARPRMWVHGARNEHKHLIFDGTLPQNENGDVGMSCHEKEREQEDAGTNTESHCNPIPTESL